MGAISIDQIPSSCRDEHCQKVLMGKNLLEGFGQPQSDDFNVTKGNWCFAVDYTLSTNTHKFTQNTQWWQEVAELLYFSDHQHYHHHHHHQMNESYTHTQSQANRRTPSSTRISTCTPSYVSAVSRSVGSSPLFNETVFFSRVCMHARAHLRVCLRSCVHGFACICVILATQPINCSRVYETTTFT